MTGKVTAESFEIKLSGPLLTVSVCLVEFSSCEKSVCYTTHQHCIMSLSLTVSQTVLVTTLKDEMVNRLRLRAGRTQGRSA